MPPLGDYLYFVDKNETEVFKIAKSEIKDYPIGNMFFGGFSPNKTIVASPYTELNDFDSSAKAMFMQPTLTL